MLWLAGAKNNDKELLLDAIEKCEIAIKHKPHHGSYNLACAYSLLNQQAKAFKFLEDSLSNKATTMTRIQIEADTDFNNIKDLPKFKELLEKYLPIETH